MTFTKKYHHLTGTHCWFCDREYAVSRNIFISCGSPLKRTREHIIPESKIKRNNPKNYIGSCRDCNTLKRNMDAKLFALHIENLMELPHHNMIKLFPMMKNRAWKLYNKTSTLHRTYKTAGAL